MATIAFIGLGIMGRPMAVNLLKAGFAVTGHNRTRQRTDELVRYGGTAADSVAAAVGDADVVAVMVPDTPDVEAVLAGPDGVFANARRGTVVIDFSSIRPDVSVRLAARANECGMTTLDAPVSGGEAGAVAGTLSIMVGGTEAAFRQAKPVLDAVGSTVVHVGPNGSGQTVKAANQLMVAGHIQLLAEALVFLESHGVDIDAALTVLRGGLAGSAVLQQKAASMVARRFDPGFRIDLHHKDLGIAMSAARATGVVIPLGAVVDQLLASARANGDGGLDHSGLFRGVERLSGRLAEEGPR